MPEKFIQPAIDITEDADISKGLSAHDFQKHLYGWFQERGMLCELRAYLRKQMIGALQNSTMGHVVTDQQNQILSPIVQATNLLVSEFLFHFNYHYSLSVFTTEVPLINILPELPISLDTKHAQKGKEWKFTEKDTRDILETLGVMGESEIGKKILESYIDSEPQSLLMCIINSIKLINKTGLLNENLFACNTYEEWIRNVGELLQFNNISVPNIKDVLSTVMTLVETERKQLRTQAREEYMKVEARLQKECDKNKEEQKKKWLTAINALEMEEAKIQKKLTRKKMEIDQYSARILKHQNLLEERYCNLTVRERDARIKECHLRKREECLKAQQQRLLLEQKAIPQLKKTSSSDIEDKKTAYTTNDACENTQYKEFIANLEIENKALQTINTEQRIRIDELTERSSLLLRDLESTQAVVNILSGNGMSRNPTLTSAALLAPTSFNLTTSIEGLVLNGGGENGSKLLPSEYSGEYRNDVKRRMIPSKKSSILSTSTSDEGTSGILGEARDKLRQLEVESEEVDRHYQHFKLKRAQHGFPFQPQFGCKQNGISLSKLQEFDNNSSYDEHKRAEISTTFNRVVSSSVLMEHNPLKEQADQQTNDRLKSNLSKPETRNIHSQKRTIKDISNTSSDLDYIFGTGTSGVSMSQVDSTNEKSVSRISSN